MGHSRPDTTQQYTDDVELDDLAEALERAAKARDAQASPDLATLETEIAKGLETPSGQNRTLRKPSAVRAQPICVS